MMTQSNMNELGHKHGQRWAQGATNAQLGRLRRLEASLEHETCYGWEWWFTENPLEAFTTAERLFFIINPKQDGDREAAAEFWQHDHEDDDGDSGDYLQGFAEGALDA